MEERLRYLFNHYLNNTCSYREMEEFLDYVRRAEHDSGLRMLIRNLYQDLKAEDIPTTHVDEKGRLVLSEPGWIPPAIVSKPRRTRPAVAGFMVFLLLALATGWLLLKQPARSERVATMSSLTKKSTVRSESKFLLLEDSTQVWLNAASSLEFPDHFDPKKRVVYLTGEAYFDVKHAEKVPFIIHTGAVSTTVLGTAFNIKAYPGEENITVSVSRGKVKVSRKDGWEATLQTGQQLKLREQENQVREKPIPAAEVAAWQQGSLIYDDVSFKDIVADLQRVYNVNIKISDPAVQEQRISTSFKKEIGVEQALQVLCHLTEKELKTLDGNYLVR
jgi:ferric-dicitrate binding protein FerR (iron transport regulator)